MDSPNSGQTVLSPLTLLVSPHKLTTWCMLITCRFINKLRSLRGLHQVRMSALGQARRVLLLGSGLSSEPLVEYLTRNRDIALTIGTVI